MHGAPSLVGARNGHPPRVVVRSHEWVTRPSGYAYCGLVLGVVGVWGMVGSLRRCLWRFVGATGTAPGAVGTAPGEAALVPGAAVSGIVPGAGTVPGVVGVAPGVPGSVPGVPGTVPGVPGTVLGTAPGAVCVGAPGVLGAGT